MGLCFSVASLFGYNATTVAYRFAEFSRLVGSASDAPQLTEGECLAFLDRELPGAMEIMTRCVNITGGSFETIGTPPKRDYTMGFKFSVSFRQYLEVLDN